MRPRAPPGDCSYPDLWEVGAARRSRRLTSAVLASAAVALLAPSLALAGGSVAVYDSLAVLRPEMAPPAGARQAAEVELAGNETESFQLSVVANAGPINGLRVELAEPLRSPGGQAIPTADVTIYREGTYRIAQRSDGEGEPGAWPDVLIPSRDVLYGEARTAFPTDVAAGAQLGIWVDVFAPAGQAPGAYAGSLTVSSSSGTIATVPVTAQVAGFSLPSTSAFKSAFHVDPWHICAAFTGAPSCNSQQQWWELEALFAELGLDDRITISNPYPTGFNAAPAGASQRGYFSTYILPLLNGTDPRVRLAGARLTSVDAYWQCVTESTTCLSDWKSLASEYGFANRFFLYDCDEPSGAAAWSRCDQTAQLAEQRWPGVRKLVTATAAELEANGAAGYTTVDTPLVNELNSQSVNRRSSYEAFLSQAPGAKEMWLYTSCMSFSCNETENAYWNGWPGYAIDEPASQAQAMGWMGFAYRASGELYYEATQTLATAATNQYYSGGNGDGNLFYAGTPNGANGSVAIGGVHPIPLETIRLKRIRDGYEDYEYLRLAEAAQGRPTVMGIVEGLFGGLGQAMNHTTVSGPALEAARAKLSGMIAPAGIAPTPTPEPTPEPTPTSEPSPKPGNPTPNPPKRGSESAGAERTGASVESVATNVASVATNVATGPSHPVVRAVSSPRSSTQLRQRGARVLISCAGACKVEVLLVVSSATAARHHLGGRRVGRAMVTIGAKPRWVVVRLDAAASRQLRGVAEASSLGLRAIARTASESLPQGA